MTARAEGWTKKNNRLVKLFTFKTFASAIAFMVEVSLFCEKINHHPEWKNVYNKLHVELTTHDKGGVTALDRKLAVHMNKTLHRYL